MTENEIEKSVNFGEAFMKNGITRIVNGLEENE